MVVVCQRLGVGRARCGLEKHLLPSAERLTSFVHVLSVSISLAAQIFAPPSPMIQPACDTLQPQLATCNTASSSSSSSGFDRLIKPSEDPERTTLSVMEDEKDRDVISSEWVELCVRRGTEGFLGSLSFGLCAMSAYNS